MTCVSVNEASVVLTLLLKWHGGKNEQRIEAGAVHVRFWEQLKKIDRKTAAVWTAWRRPFSKRLKLFSCLRLSLVLFCMWHPIKRPLEYKIMTLTPPIWIINPHTKKDGHHKTRVPLFWDSKSHIVASDLFHLNKAEGICYKILWIKQKKCILITICCINIIKHIFQTLRQYFLAVWFVSCRGFPSIVHYVSCIILTFTFCHGGWNCQQLFRTFSKNEPVICLFSFSGAFHRHITVSSPQMISQRKSFLCLWLMPGLCSKLVIQFFVFEKETVLSAGEVWTKMQNQA